jgi:hypothetical protein
MADNTTLDGPGAGGDTIRTDEIGGVKWPISKLAYGADGTADIVTSTATNPLPVALSDTDNTALDAVAQESGGNLDTIAGDTTSIDNKLTSGTVIGAVEITDTSFAVADGNALGEGVLVQGDDGTDRKNINVDATTGDVQVDVTNTVTVDGSGVTQPVSGTVTTTSAAADNNKVSTDNSTTSLLGISGVYTGTAEDVSAYTAVTIHLSADQDSATDGMTFEFCPDNSFGAGNTDSYAFTLTANTKRRFQFPVTAQYFRVKYTNGGTGQGDFDVQTILHKQNVLTSIHRLSNDMSPDRSAQVVKSVLFAQAAGSGDFTAVDATAGGNLKTSIEEISGGLDIGAGNAGTETQRVSISTDDVNLSAIKTATETVAAAVSTEMQVDVVSSALPTGAATAANQLPDGHAVTVDNTTGSPANVQIGDGTSQATVRNLAANDSLNVAIVDGSGDQITSFGGGTQYTEDDAAAANPVGTAPILVRQDTPASRG